MSHESTIRSRTSSCDSICNMESAPTAPTTPQGHNASFSSPVTVPSRSRARSSSPLLSRQRQQQHPHDQLSKFLAQCKRKRVIQFAGCFVFLLFYTIHAKRYESRVIREFAERESAHHSTLVVAPNGVGTSGSISGNAVVSVADGPSGRTIAAGSTSRMATSTTDGDQDHEPTNNLNGIVNVNVNVSDTDTPKSIQGQPLHIEVSVTTKPETTTTSTSTTTTTTTTPSAAAEAVRHREPVNPARSNITNNAAPDEMITPRPRFALPSVHSLQSVLITKFRRLEREIVNAERRYELQIIEENRTMHPYGAFLGDSLPNLYSIPSNIVDSDNDNDDDEIVLATHISMNKLERLQVQLKWWDGPASVAVLLRHKAEINQLINFWERHYGEQYVNQDRPRYRISFHVYMEVTPVRVDPDTQRQYRRLLPYPHNNLRNLAMMYFDEYNTVPADEVSNSPTEPKKTGNAPDQFFLAIDVDFITSLHCRAALQKLIREQGGEPKNKDKNGYPIYKNQIRHELMFNHTVMVLPAFAEEPRNSTSNSTTINVDSIDFESDDNMLPKTREELKTKIADEQIEFFRWKKFRPGHAPTNFERWLAWDEAANTTQDGSMEGYWYPVDYKESFEPYIIGYVPPKHGSRSDRPNYRLPDYWTTFRGYGKNKLSWIMELYRSGFSFGVLQTPWVIHMYHPAGNEGKRGIELHFNKNHEYPRFLRYLNLKYGVDKKFEEERRIERERKKLEKERIKLENERRKEEEKRARRHGRKPRA